MRSSAHILATCLCAAFLSFPQYAGLASATSTQHTRELAIPTKRALADLTTRDRSHWEQGKVHPSKSTSSESSQSINNPLPFTRSPLTSPGAHHPQAPTHRIASGRSPPQSSI